MPQDRRERLLADLLGPVHMHMKRAEAAYHAYLADGRKFIYTQVIRDSNEAVRDLLLRRGYLLRDDLQVDALKLIEHLDIWLLKWYATREANQPALDDPFIFTNASVFPKQAAENLEAMYAQLASDVIDG